MSASVMSIQDQFDAEPSVKISFKLLLCFYLMVPLCVFVQLFDQWFFGGFVQQSLPSSPKHFLLFQVLFGTPHIIASSIIISTNREYLNCFKWKLVLMSLAIILFFGVGSLFIPYIILYLVSASWTVYHVLKQQYGIGRGVYRLPNWAFYLLMWLAVLAGIFVYIGIFLKNSLDAHQAEWVMQTAGALSVCLLLMTFFCHRYVKNRDGQYFMWANTLLVLSSFYLYVQQYYFLAILIPRIVHDVTAYVFYLCHDYNKHHGQAKNFLYRWTRFLRLPIFVVLPILSIGLTVLLQLYGDQMVNAITQLFFGMEVRKAVTLGLVGYLALMHYYTEAFTWRADSPYRKFIAFKKW